MLKAVPHFRKPIFACAEDRVQEQRVFVGRANGDYIGPGGYGKSLREGTYRRDAIGVPLDRYNVG